jgi:hypothetical protein
VTELSDYIDSNPEVFLTQGLPVQGAQLVLTTIGREVLASNVIAPFLMRYGAENETACFTEVFGF